MIKKFVLITMLAVALTVGSSGSLTADDADLFQTRDKAEMT
ncbi:hypothetical protein ACE1TH_10990 [Shouchella sp. JSM 1781072]|nr:MULTISPECIES: hypothetical protein [Bacillaceae]